MRFEVVGGNRLVGTVRVPGAKNSILKSMAALLLPKAPPPSLEVPDFLDVTIMAELLRRLGCEVEPGGSAVGLSASTCPTSPWHQADYDLVRKMRASSRAGARPSLAWARLMSPCPAVADRLTRLDMHVNGLTRLGAEVTSEHGFLIAKAAQLHVRQRSGWIFRASARPRTC